MAFSGSEFRRGHQLVRNITRLNQSYVFVGILRAQRFKKTFSYGARSSFPAARLVSIGSIPGASMPDNLPRSRQIFHGTAQHLLTLSRIAFRNLYQIATLSGGGKSGITPHVEGTKQPKNGRHRMSAEVTGPAAMDGHRDRRLLHGRRQRREAFAYIYSTTAYYRALVGPFEIGRRGGKVVQRAKSCRRRLYYPEKLTFVRLRTARSC